MSRVRYTTFTVHSFPCTDMAMLGHWDFGTGSYLAVIVFEVGGV